MFAMLKTFGKLNAIIVFAGVATLTLFYGMQRLVMVEQGLPARVDAVSIQDVTLPDWEPVINRAAPRPEQPAEPPQLPRDLVVDSIDAGPVGIRLAQLPANDPVALDDGFFLGPADGNAMPVAQIQPVYPDRALVRGVEGFVIVEFDVSETGTVINPRILGAEPAGIFEQAALRAIARWKYNPKVVAGRAVKMNGLQTRFSFTLKE